MRKRYSLLGALFLSVMQAMKEAAEMGQPTPPRAERRGRPNLPRSPR